MGERFSRAGRQALFASLAGVLTAACFVVAGTTAAQESAPLIDPRDPAREWKFDNGKEFPGATGSLASDPQAQRQGRGSLKLVGDFHKGGNYVQAGRSIDKIDVRELSMWVRSPDSNRFSLRLIDASGQCHQIKVQMEETTDWQRIVLPLERFFAARGTTEAVPGIAQYEYWGGAKDGAWHGPATAIYLLLGKGDAPLRTLWLNEVSILVRPTAVAGAEVASRVRLDELVDGEHDWRFSKGDEFPGAKGSLAVAADQPAKGKHALQLSGDFTGGGAYVAAIKNLSALAGADASVIRLQAKSEEAASITVLLSDATGQAHQKKGVKITPDGKWHELVLDPKQIAGGEHWGGANDGKWHGPPRELVISLTAASDAKNKKPALLLSDVQAEVRLPVFAQGPAAKYDFEGPLDKEWTVEGDVSVDAARPAGEGGGALRLSRPLDSVNKPISATSAFFPAAPGRWEVRLTEKAALHSPDSSYNAVAKLSCFDAEGKTLDEITILDVYGSHDWKARRQVVSLPAKTAKARFQVQLHKTYGTFHLDDLSAAYLAPAPLRDDRIVRALFSTSALGNLLLPTDSRIVSASVECSKALRDHQREMTWVVRDYWGAEQTLPAAVRLETGKKEKGRIFYEAKIDLSTVPLEIGRYYEVHATLPQGEAPGPGVAVAEPFKASTSFAILPEAETKKYKPEEVPFTSRNWDNRFAEYVRLTDRLGVRICGLWGRWSDKPPYAAEAPQIELATSLGMGWLTTTPAADVERGGDKYDEKALREGARNLIAKFGKHRPMIVNLGNEPHGTGKQVQRNVEAYRILYEEIKKVDPTIPVVATSVEPNEEYFKLGYGKYCDAFDFHIYEDSENVRRTIAEYRALQKKYDCVKPIWSTELGLNSQGMTRRVVASELFKKFAVFFAAGGENVSWFGLLYPDGEGKLAGSSSEAHNVFDCRFNRYAPRLDAVAYYNAVNAICVKKFADEKHYLDDVHAVHFRDAEGRCLTFLWTAKGRKDVSIPLPGVEEVSVIRLDGARRTLSAAGREVTLTVSEDPLLLLYQGGETKTLPAALGAPAAALSGPPQGPSRRGGATFVVAGPAAEKAEFVAPQFWSVQRTPVDAGGVQFKAAAPAGTSAREADFTVRLRDADGKVRGELYYLAPLAD